MPRYRKLHTKTLESLDMNDMPSDFCRLFWVLLPLVLCREGRGLNSATWLKSKLFPLREDVTVKQVQGALDWCIERGMVVPYSVENRAYFFVPSFHKYQGNTAKESQSDYPPPPSQVESKSGVTPELVESKSGVTPELVESKSGTDAVCSIQMQYSDADADASSVCDDDDAIVAALESVQMDQIEAVILEARQAGMTPQQIIETCAWGKEKKKSAAILRTMFRKGEAHRPRAPENDRRRYASSNYAHVES